MFGKNKSKNAEPPLVGEIRDKLNAMQTPIHLGPPSLVETLRDRRADKIKTANELDREIAALDSEITWLERNPKAQGVLRELMHKHEGVG